MDGYIAIYDGVDWIPHKVKILNHDPVNDEYLIKYYKRGLPIKVRQPSKYLSFTVEDCQVFCDYLNRGATLDG